MEKRRTRVKATAEPLPEPPPRSPRRAPGPSPTAGAPCPLLQVPQFRRGAAGRAAGAGSRRSPHCWSIAVPAPSIAHWHRALHAGTKHHTPAPSTARWHQALHAGTEHHTPARSITPRHEALHTGTEHRTVTPSITCRPRALHASPSVARQHRSIARWHHRSTAPWHRSVAAPAPGHRHAASPTGTVAVPAPRRASLHRHQCVGTKASLTASTRGKARRWPHPTARCHRAQQGDVGTERV